MTGIALGMLLLWLAAGAATGVALACVRVGRRGAGASLFAAVIAGLLPSLSNSPITPGVLERPALAAFALLPALLVHHIQSWQERGSSVNWLVLAPTVIAGALTVAAYSPFADPLCTRGCSAPVGPVLGSPPTALIVDLVCVCTAAAAAAGLTVVHRANLPSAPAIGGMSAMTVVVALSVARATVWGLTVATPAQAAALVVPVAVVAVGTAAHLLRLRHVGARLMRLAAQLAGLEAAGDAGSDVVSAAHFALPSGGWVDAVGAPVVREPDPCDTVVIRDDCGRDWVRLTDLPYVSSPGVDAHDPRLRLLLGIAWQNALVRSEERQVETSRARIVARGDEERRTVERDLHDGVQQHLVSVRLQLALARSTVHSTHVHRLIEADAHTLRALSGLREICQGLFPRSLQSDGLGLALRELESRTTMTLTMIGPFDRLSLPAATTAYAVIARLAESTPDAAGCRVEIRTSGESLVLSVAPASPRSSFLAAAIDEVTDRVGAVGGIVDVLDVDSGVRLEVVLPCGS